MPAHAVVTVSVENAGVQATTLVSPAYVETLDATTIPATTNFGGSPVTGMLSGFEVGSAASYGGVGYYYGGAYGSAYYGIVHGTGTISLSHSVKYFGLWAAALDGNNSVELLQGANSLGVFNLVQAIGALGSAYNGNPNTPANVTPNYDSSEKFAFVNFSSTTGFDTIKLIQNNGGGFEFDNLTVGDVPEPATWAMMLVGFGAMGYATRRNRKVTVSFS